MQQHLCLSISGKTYSGFHYNTDLCLPLQSQCLPSS
uniref:Uncharacterized protein n=1 Tax=Anguilla anguilla TaxID=7936 RepID=A0A0E9W721_ANGAN